LATISFARWSLGLPLIHSILIPVRAVKGAAAYFAAASVKAPP
jgi:hypothetical protein